MSVVNKMLQDLEARKTQTDEIQADYQAPPKKQSKPLVILLLILAIAAIIFALTDIHWLFSETKTEQSLATTETQTLASNVPRKMSMVSEESQQQSVTSQNNTVQKAKTDNIVAAPSAKIQTPSELSDAKPRSPQQSDTTEAQINSIQVIDTQEVATKASRSPEIITATAAEPTSRFSKTNSNKENSGDSLKQRIVESLKEDDLDLARSLLYKLLETEPTNIKARKKLASLLFSQGNYAQAKQLLVKGIALHPAQGDLRLMLARLLMIQKEPAQAIDILAKFQPITGNQVEYLGYRAALAQQLKHTKMAMSDYQSLTQIESNNAKWWLGLGIAKDQLGEIDQAVQAYTNAKSLAQLDNSVHDFIQQRISVLAGDQ
ncbi:MAG: tetratricopeptide repeat protein [Paraglaciecola sp.]|uniref:tetratricopeptide repeat protein n=1 Tax=Paraglaciecola sp. TaxID=1920173 RepID=UPI0032995D60